MLQRHNSQGGDYVMPSAIIGSLVLGHTWELSCSDCDRFIVVDVIKLLEHYDPYDRVQFDGMKCAVCGSRLKHTGGLVVSGLRHRGRWPAGQTLVMAGGGPWRGVATFKRRKETGTESLTRVPDNLERPAGSWS